MTEPLLEVRNLQSGYGDVQVLWDISLSVLPGQITCIVGSNGAGKTTLLQTISGLISSRAGQIHFQGAELTNRNPDDVLGAGIAHVPEGRRLFQGLSVRDNLMLGAYLRKDKQTIAEDLDFVFDLFPILRDRRWQDATTLSGGEQQMCAIGRGIMSRPKLLMIDELSLGLAPRLVEHLSAALADINSTGLTILLVEQDVTTAFEVAETAFVIETGRTTRTGPTAELVNDPKIREAYLGL
jgi:branched-chain amino acid transport system ATP-binding protein